MAQLQTPNVGQVQQMQHQKITNGVDVGLKLLATEGVNAPIIYSEGITDLRWFLNAILSGQFSVDLDPGGALAAAGRPQEGPTKLRPLSAYDLEDGGEEN